MDIQLLNMKLFLFYQVIYIKFQYRQSYPENYVSPNATLAPKDIKKLILSSFWIALSRRLSGPCAQHKRLLMKWPTIKWEEPTIKLFSISIKLFNKIMACDKSFALWKHIVFCLAKMATNRILLIHMSFDPITVDFIEQTNDVLFFVQLTFYMFSMIFQLIAYKCSISLYFIISILNAIFYPHYYYHSLISCILIWASFHAFLVPYVMKSTSVIHNLRKILQKGQ